MDAGSTTHSTLMFSSSISCTQVRIAFCNQRLRFAGVSFIPSQTRPGLRYPYRFTTLIPSSSTCIEHVPGSVSAGYTNDVSVMPLADCPPARSEFWTSYSPDARLLHSLTAPQLSTL
jgi:hypothetical protein